MIARNFRRYPEALALQMDWVQRVLCTPLNEQRPATEAGRGEQQRFPASRKATMVSVVRRNKHRKVGVNDRGRPVGETHPLAKLSDEDVELIHELREAGLSYAQIARKFDDEVTVSKSHVRDILTGRRRGQMPVRFKVRECA